MDIPVVIAECVSVAPTEIVSALIHVESAGAPHALTVIGKSGVALKPQPNVKSLEEARSVAAMKVAAGYTVKVGLMQVSSTDLARFGIPLGQGFLPCPNILAGSRVYSEAADRVAKLGKYFKTPLRKTKAALSAYKTGSPWAGISSGYAAQVVRVMAGGDEVAENKAAAVVVEAPVSTHRAALSQSATRRHQRIEKPAREVDFTHDITIDFSGSGTQSNWANM